MNKIFQFLREVRGELAKVVWPRRREALKMTGIVILFSVAVALFLGLIDFGLTRIVGLIAQ